MNKIERAISILSDTSNGLKQKRVYFVESDIFTLSDFDESIVSLVSALHALREKLNSSPEKPDNWIPVEERLPAGSREHSIDGHLWLALQSLGRDGKKRTMVKKGFLDLDGAWIVHEFDCCYYSAIAAGQKVVAWKQRELRPEPYEPEKEDKP